MKLFFVSIGSVFSAASILIDNSADGLPIWVWRAFITALLGLLIWFAKNALDSAKAANVLRDKRISDCDEKYIVLLKMTAAHDVMYEIWLDDLVESEHHPSNGKRKTDQIHRLITQIAEARNK